MKASSDFKLVNQARFPPKYQQNWNLFCYLGALFLTNIFLRLANHQTFFISHNNLADDGTHALASSISVL